LTTSPGIEANSHNTPGIIHLAKLAEEAHEAQQATADDLPAELADVLEVLQALTAAFGLTWEQLQELADDKRTVEEASSGGSSSTM
jgi:predicted house-cleaning noncanonical NTP pyrophosphatase (MazG superfamily)